MDIQLNAQKYLYTFIHAYADIHACAYIHDEKNTNMCTYTYTNPTYRHARAEYLKVSRTYIVMYVYFVWLFPYGGCSLHPRDVRYFYKTIKRTQPPPPPPPLPTL